jgi:hypothetical protein
MCIRSKEKLMDAHTRIKPKLVVVSRRLPVARQVSAADVDIVALILVPDDYLLCTLDALEFVVLTPYRGFGGCQGNLGGGTGNHASERLKVYVRLAATVLVYC